MVELWKDIKGYEGRYQVSNTGKVRSVPRFEKDKNGRVVRYQSRPLKAIPNSSGYFRVELKARGIGKRFFIHRLVAEHFVDNPDPDTFTIVNHLDCNFRNNNSDNLEWTTIQGNYDHAARSGRMDRTEEWLKHLRETNEKNGKSVMGVNVKSGEIVRYVCLNDCRKDGFLPSMVCKCCKGERNQHKGFIWRYADEWS